MDVSLEWSPPSSDGCCEVTGYVIESSCGLNATLPANSWSFIFRDVGETFCFFAISSVNEKGQSEEQIATYEVQGFDGFDEFDGVTAPVEVSLSDDLQTLILAWPLFYLEAGVANYAIELKKTTGIFFEYPNCSDGSVVLQRQCNILLSSEFALANDFFLDDSAAKVYAVTPSARILVAHETVISYPEHIPTDKV